MKFDEDVLYFINTDLQGKRASLFELANWKNGLAFKKIDFTETGKPVIKIAELNNGITGTTAFTDKQHPSEVHLTKGDLIFSWSGNPQTSIDTYWYDLPDGWLNQHIFKVTPDETKVDKYFFFYVMKYLKPTFTAIATNKQTTGLGHVTIADLKKLSVIVPERKVQKKIAKLLKTIDDKIYVNNEINENLQEQAQTLYANMFLQNNSDQWSEGALSDMAEIIMGQSPKGDTYNEDGVGTVFFQGRGEFGFRFPTRRLFTTDPKRMAQSNDVLMSVRAPVGDLNVAYESCCIGRGLGAIRSKDGHQSFVLYTVFSLREKLDMFNGEGTVFGSINCDALNSMPIVIPTKEEMDRFEEIAAPMDAAIRNNYEEICHLEAIKDNLLPRLMSGELDVSDLDL